MRSVGHFGFTRLGSTPCLAKASLMAARSTIAGIPLKTHRNEHTLKLINCRHKEKPRDSRKILQQNPGGQERNLGSVPLRLPVQNTGDILCLHIEPVTLPDRGLQQDPNTERQFFCRGG